VGEQGDRTGELGGDAERSPWRRPLTGAEDAKTITSTHLYGTSSK
jgi:hypothetical protein